MGLSAYESSQQLIASLKANPAVDASMRCERILQLFPLLMKEEQKNLSCHLCNWATDLPEI
jgi:hypothetical protein